MKLDPINKSTSVMKSNGGSAKKCLACSCSGSGRGRPPIGRMRARAAVGEKVPRGPDKHRPRRHGSSTKRGGSSLLFREKRPRKEPRKSSGAARAASFERSINRGSPRLGSAALGASSGLQVVRILGRRPAKLPRPWLALNLRSEFSIRLFRRRFFPLVATVRRLRSRKISSGRLSWSDADCERKRSSEKNNRTDPSGV